MTDGPRRVTLTKAERESPVGRELVDLLVVLSDDGQVTHDETNRLRAWLEVDRGVDFAACGFLYEILDTIAADGEVTDAELDTLMLGIERVLPSDVRRIARDKRRERREATRRANAAKRAAARAEAVTARELARPLYRGDFIIAGVRYSERREACEALAVDEVVVLEREPDNRHDKNAILIFDTAGNELGYVPRSEAAEMAPLIDANAFCEARVKKLLETADGITLPVILSLLRPQPAGGSVQVERSLQQSSKRVPLAVSSRPAPVSPAPPAESPEARQPPTDAPQIARLQEHSSERPSSQAIRPLRELLADPAVETRAHRGCLTVVAMGCLMGLIIGMLILAATG
jgi:HIRAN domain